MNCPMVHHKVLGALWTLSFSVVDVNLPQGAPPRQQGGPFRLASVDLMLEEYRSRSSQPSGERASRHESPGKRKRCS
jgi:hypothetical protein